MKSFLTVLAALLLGIGCYLSPAAAAEEAGIADKIAAKAKLALPAWSEVERVARGALAKSGGEQSGALVTQKDAAAALAAVAALGWKPSDEPAITNSVLTDGDPLAAELRSPKGRALSAKLATMPLGYDRLERLQKLNGGDKIVRDLVRGPDGYKMVEYLATAKGGKEMGRMLSQAPHGDNFNQPTGRIYTADQLIGRLKQSYALDEQRTKK